MKHKLFEGLTPKEVLDNLEGICSSKQEMVYEKKLSDQELQKEEKEFIQDNVKLAKLNDDFDRIKQEFKSKMKPVEQLIGERLGILKTKSRQVEGQVYLVDDQEQGLMGYYDPEGNLINVRKLLPEERQLRMATKLAANE